MRVDHRRLDVGVTEQFLNRPDVVAIFEQMRRERVAEGWQLAGLITFARRTASFTAF